MPRWPSKSEAKQELSRESRKARGLTWKGCWGCSSSEVGIYVLATLVGHIHLQSGGQGVKPSHLHLRTYLFDPFWLGEPMTPMKTTIENH